MQGATPFYTAVYSVLDGNEQNPRIKLFETFGATVQALKVGDVDTVLTDGTAGMGYVEASNGGLLAELRHAGSMLMRCRESNNRIRPSENI